MKITRASDPRLWRPELAHFSESNRRVRVVPLPMTTAPHLRNVIVEERRNGRWATVSTIAACVERAYAKEVAQKERARLNCK